MRNGRLAGMLLDRPNERSLHRSVVPRIGGIGMAAGMLAFCAAAPALPPSLVAALAAASALAFLSWIDDYRGLSPAIRLPAHLLAAAGWLHFAAVPPGPAALLVLAIPWAANLFNFMDGSDGLAGGMTVFGFGTYAWVALRAGDPALALLSIAFVAAALAFLCFNWPKASLFLGDSGSIPLGFSAAVLGVYGWQQQLWAWHLPVVAFFPFVFDASFTLVRRVLAGRIPWQAHREHLYQRFALAGAGHAGLLARALPIMAACALIAASMSSDSSHGAFILAGLTIAGLLLARQVAATELRSEAKEQ